LTSIFAIDALILNVLDPIDVIFSLWFVLEIGKASPVFKEGAVIGYGGRVVEVNKNPFFFFLHKLLQTSPS
jgi:hypothetical protein